MFMLGMQDTTRINIGPTFVYNIIFIKELVDTCEDNITLYLFTDDAKMYCHVKDLADQEKLKRGIENFVAWTNKWQVSLNVNNVKLYQYITENTQIVQIML